MKNEESRKKAESRLTEEERVQRLQYGGEGMRAELAMEESEMRRGGQRGSSFEQGLTPEEQERRRSMEEGKIPYPGYGEEQKAEMAMWGRDYRVAQEIREDWRGQQRQAGVSEQASPRAGFEESFAQEELRLRDETLSQTAPAQDQPVRREPTVVAPVGGGYGMRQATTGGEYEMNREEMMRREREQAKYPTGTGSYYSESRERPVREASPFSQAILRGQRPMSAESRAREERIEYPSGTGSYYSESRERPVETAAPEAYFGGGTEMSLAERERAVAQREADIARREDMMRREQARVLGYPSGTGSYYSESRERPVERAAPEAYFGSGMPEAAMQAGPRMRREPMGREEFRPEEYIRYPTGTGSYYSESREYPVQSAAPEAYFGAGTGRPMERREMPREEMRPGEYLQYPSGTGSYYSESRERPVQSAAPEAYFGAGTGRPMERRAMEPKQAPPSMAHAAVPREEMMREGEKAYWYRPASGSYYSETWERPTGDVSPEAYYPRAYGPPPAMPESQPRGTMEAVQDTGEQAYAKVKQVGQQISEKMPPQVSQVTEKAKTSIQQVAEQPSTIAQPGRAEDAASSSGEAIGAGLRKIANVIAGFTAGFQRGMNAGQQPKQAQQPPAAQPPQQQVQQETTYQSQQRQQMQEAPQTYVTEEEKIKKREVRQQ